MKKYGKEILKSYQKFLDGEQFEVLILDDGDYYNVHIISQRFKDEDLNTLRLQEDKDYVKNFDEYFDKKYLIGALMEHFIWDRFYAEEGCVICNVEILEINGE